MTPVLSLPVTVPLTDESSFMYPVESEDYYQGITAFKALLMACLLVKLFTIANLINSAFVATLITAEESVQVYAKFRADITCEAFNDWSVTTIDECLKQNEAPHFVVRYNPLIAHEYPT